MESNNRICPFCESVEDEKKFIKKYVMPDERRILSVALVKHAMINGKRRGRVTDYMKNGKGYPLNYCPVCGKRIDAKCSKKAEVKE